MFLLTFALPFAAALLCLGLDRLVATRWLGIGAVVALLVAGVLLSAAPSPALPGFLWATLGEQPVRLAMGFDAASGPLALLALCGGALALLALALALPSDLRGFGGLFAALLFALLAIVVGLAIQEPLLLPFAWALAALCGFAGLRATGTMAGADALPTGLLAGMAGALLLVAAALLPAHGPQDGSGATGALICWTLVALLVFGAPVFHALYDEPASAPAALAGVLLPLGLPLLGGYSLIRFAANAAAISPTFRIVWALLGLLTLLACAAGAARTTRLREIIGWQFSAQLGLVFLSISQPGDLLPHAGALALLMNAALTTLAGFLAVAALERQAGTDDLSEIGIPGLLLVPGLALLFSAASALGAPGAWGWWAQGVLVEQLRSTMPWLIPPLLAGSALRALAYLAPLAAFWRASPATPRRGWPTIVAQFCPALAALPLLAWGVAPQLAWGGWLAAAQNVFVAGAPAPPAPGMPVQIASILSAIALLGLPILAQRARPRCAPNDRDTRNAALLTPQALGQSLRGLSWLADPGSFFEGVWAGLLRVSQGAAQMLALFEQRYYLAGLMIAVIVVIMLMI
jgi:formate hydrogenlyase subunit 3/multisubunit Na+/H+ antiporter MnhD subunit